MAFKITYALARGSWEGAVGVSEFTRSGEVFSTVEEFLDYKNSDSLIDANEESVNRGEATIQQELSSDGKTLIATMEFTTEEIFNYWYTDDIRLVPQAQEVRCYNVEEAAAPEFVNTFDEESGIYFHTSEHLF
jgi:hypothetical protein